MRSLMPSGRDPQNIFLGPSTGACTAGAAAATPGKGSCPNLPWWRANVTSHGLSEPGNIKLRSQASFAARACSDVAKVTNAHCLPGSHPVFTKTSVIVPK
eukprot:SRR837773.14293.p2 GENE.SRR837773.14293~~SRR837773.14293.p2  ORF type:complete len:100 (+),score=5.13 SRR837773.14293:461-760(+)